MKELVEFMAKGLVENPDEVEATEEWDGHRYVVHLDVAESDMGKVIGRGGRVAEAMRTLLKAAAARQDTRAVLDIGD
jgi:predicted RNA-binding protein YlqC (UPF0109 family)